MNKLLKRLEPNSEFFASIEKCEKEIVQVLNQYLTNFPEFTDHSFSHSKRVLNFASYLLEGNIEKLNDDEIYILVMACYLHDIGMSPSKIIQAEIRKSDEFKSLKKSQNMNLNDYVRSIHHSLSYDYVTEQKHWKSLLIPNERYATAIALVSKGHRKEDLMDYSEYAPKYTVKSGLDFVCIPFLAVVLRMADELDITNDRVPDLLFDEYLPENKISKKEWEKHRNNYCVNFDENKIIITANCSKDSYEAVSRHVKKIKESLEYVNKVSRNLPIKGKSLRVEFDEIVSNIETVGFVPRNIGFNLDLQNTLNTLIGRKLYSDKFVAIREALQNSIDICRYKKTLVSSFAPKIVVSLLNNNQLVVEDNGLGMDDYIVENFFAKLGSSYYMQKKIRKNFDSISEFGVGVFSFFLLCDYFEVETKMLGKEALKFRVTKNADTHFVFYDKLKKETAGTKITLFLKDSLSGEALEDKVRHYFRYLEFPLQLNIGKTQKTIRQQKFDINKKDVLRSVVKLTREDERKDIDILKIKIDTGEYSGICGLLLGKDKTGILTPRSFYELLHENNMSVAISQKGVFVKKTANTLFFDNMFGDINLKNKNNLSLDRDSILDREVLESVLSDFAIKIMETLFKGWKHLTSTKRFELSVLLLNHSFKSRGLTEDVGKRLIDNLFVMTCENTSIKNGSLKSFLKRNSSFALLVCSNKNRWCQDRYKKIKEVSALFNKPLLVHFPYVNDDFYLKLFKAMNKKITIETIDGKSVYVIHNKQREIKQKYLFGYPSFDYLAMNTKWISVSPGVGLTYPLNVNHPIVKVLMKKSKSIKQDLELHGFWELFLQEIHQRIFCEHVYEEPLKIQDLDRMNKALRLINSKMKIKLKVSERDFQMKLRKKYRGMK